MATLIRTGISRVVNIHGLNRLKQNKNLNLLTLRCISSKVLRQSIPEIRKKPAPWNYKEKTFTLLNYFTDITTSRFDENTKIIVVEGPPAAGKTEVAKKLADELDMFYMPEANLDMVYINDYGFDLRKLDEQLPDDCKSFDINNFLLNPSHKLCASFQINQYDIKYCQYIDALAHLLNTGQGVILDRCVYSDFVFAEAMRSQNYISKGAYDAYFKIRNNSIDELLRPHLILYLDVPVQKTLENIKKRNLSYEVNSPAMNPNYLRALENSYKQKYLKNISTHSHLMIYDWSDGGDIEIVVEDIERVDFTREDNQDPKLQDWDMGMEEDWACLRYKYSRQKSPLLSLLNLPLYDVPELVLGAEDLVEKERAYKEAPGQLYEYGYNKSMGDKGFLFKTKVTKEFLPLRERRNFENQVFVN